MEDALVSNGDQDKQPKNETRSSRIRKYVQYYALKWSLQLICAWVVFVIVLWGAIQFMRIWNVLGISQEPPGLTYLLDYPAPPPPPMGLDVNAFAAG
jgi:hypothetical protein